MLMDIPKHLLRTDTIYKEASNLISNYARNLPKMTKFKRSLFFQNRLHLYQKAHALLQYAPNMCTKFDKNPLKAVGEIN